MTKAPPKNHRPASLLTSWCSSLTTRLLLCGPRPRTHLHRRSIDTAGGSLLASVKCLPMTSDEFCCTHRLRPVHLTRCQLTSVLLKVVDVLLPFICVMCNVTSLREGCLPHTQRTAIIMPVLKKQDTDRDEPKNYQPISNLTFISKVLKHIVVEQVIQHLEEADLMLKFQSTYHKHHCAESTHVGFVRHS